MVGVKRTIRAVRKMASILLIPRSDSLWAYPASQLQRMTRRAQFRFSILEG
jgi:hypothetical protein